MTRPTKRTHKTRSHRHYGQDNNHHTKTTKDSTAQYLPTEHGNRHTCHRSNQLRRCLLRHDRDSWQRASSCHRRHQSGVKSRTVVKTAPTKQSKPVNKASTTAPQPARATKPTNCPEYASLVSQYAWDATTALAIMRAESGCNSRAYNASNYDGSNDAGLMQINSIHVSSGLISSEARFNPAENMRAAYAIYQGAVDSSGDGWSAWAAYNNGSYALYL